MLAKARNGKSAARTNRRRVKPGELKARQVWELSADERRDPPPLERHVDRYGQFDPSLTEQQLLRGARIARQLSKLTDGRISVSYSPGTYCTDDLGARGHIFHGHANPSCSEEDFTDFIHLDDRRGDLADQLIAELERIAGEYLCVAALVTKGKGVRQ